MLSHQPACALPTPSSCCLHMVIPNARRLVEQTEAHVLVRLLLLLLLLGSRGVSSRGSASSSRSRSGSSSNGTAGRDGGQLLGTLLDQLFVELVCSPQVTLLGNAIAIYAYLVDVLALKLLEQRVDARLLSLDAHRAEDLLDVLSRGGGVAAEAEKEVSC